MKWVKFNYQNQPTFGVLSNDTTIQITTNTWADVLAGFPAQVTAEISVQDVDLLAPVDRPGKIVCIGLNYLDHCRETNTPPPERPLIFTKFTTTLANPNSNITWSPKLTQKVDFEAELAVIFGKTCRNVSETDALDYVAGYTTANDVTARDLQRGDGQWIRGKSLDTFCPLGPNLVTADEIVDPQNLAIRSTLNGQVMQESYTSEMIFSVAKLIAFGSQAFTWEPGDVLLTGTPHGVGIGRDPQVFMQNGDEIVIEIDGIGRLVNTCRTV